MDIKNYILKTVNPFIQKMKTGVSDIHNNPFYQSAILDKNLNTENCNSEITNAINIIDKKYNIPLELKYMYFGLYDKNSEIKFNDVTFYSLSKILEIMNDYINFNQHDFIDVGLQYAGMGWVFVIAWHTEYKKFFIRLDGGSNGYDVNDNFNQFIKNKIIWNNDMLDKQLSWLSLMKIIDQLEELSDYKI